MSNAALFADDLKLTPYWWDDVPRPALPQVPPPAKADVVVVGSGYTGLAVALQTARGGRATVVLDAEDAGWGCSTRNGGQISTSVKPNYAALVRRFGPEHAFRIVKEGQNSLAWVGAFVAAEGIDCDFRIAGRFHAAHNPARYEALAQMLATQPKGLDVAAHMVPRAEQWHELGTDAYYGGVLSTSNTRRCTRRGCIRGCWTAPGTRGQRSSRIVPPPRSIATAVASASSAPAAVSSRATWWWPPTGIPAG